jgi:alpha-galactosidase
VTALFGHLGIEWDLLTLGDQELDRLAWFVDLHKRHRPLLHAGDVVRFDTDGGLVAHGVYAADRAEGLISVARLRSGPALAPAPLRLPDLDPDAVYAVELIELPGHRWTMDREPPAWSTGGLRIDGRTLAHHGLQLPALLPDTALVVHLDARGSY